MKAAIAALMTMATAGIAGANPGQARPRTDTHAAELLGGVGNLLRFEIGADLAQTDINGSAVKHELGTVVLAHEGPADTVGTTARLLVGPSRLYIGLELGYATVTSAPGFQQNLALRAEMPGADTQGYALTVAWPLGFQATAGPVLLGFEGVVGWRRFSIEEPRSGESIVGSVPLFEARARAGVWVTPSISVAAMVGTGVINDSRTASLVVSFSRLPWDGDR